MLQWILIILPSLALSLPSYDDINVNLSISECCTFIISRGVRLTEVDGTKHNEFARINSPETVCYFHVIHLRFLYQ
jgi:hypothetical protein